MVAGEEESLEVASKRRDFPYEPFHVTTQRGPAVKLDSLLLWAKVSRNNSPTPPATIKHSERAT